MNFEDVLAERLAERIAVRVVKLVTERLSEQPAGPLPALFDVKGAGSYLGRSEQSIQRLIAERVLPVVRHGRRVHLWRKDLDKWIEFNRE